MPQFDAGVSKIAKAVMQNPTGKAFDYDGVILMGTGLTEVSRVPFHLNANESKEISFPVVMPLVAGIYPFYICVLSSGVSIAGPYKGEDITIVEGLPYHKYSIGDVIQFVQMADPRDSSPWLGTYTVINIRYFIEPEWPGGYWLGYDLQRAAVFAPYDQLTIETRLVDGNINGIWIKIA